MHDTLYVHCWHDGTCVRDCMRRVTALAQARRREPAWYTTRVRAYGSAGGAPESAESSRGGGNAIAHTQTQGRRWCTTNSRPAARDCGAISAAERLRSCSWYYRNTQAAEARGACGSDCVAGIVV
jgi:hypothetical protein